jgi:hypothetical protein
MTTPYKPQLETHKAGTVGCDQKAIDGVVRQT